MPEDVPLTPVEGEGEEAKGLPLSAENVAVTAGELATTAAAVHLPRLPEQYARMTAALHELGFSEQNGIPTFEQVLAVIGSETAAWLIQRATAGHQDELVIAPSVQAVGLMGSETSPGLLPRYDRNRGRRDQTFVSEDVVTQCLDRSPLHDNGAPEAFSAAVLLGDVTDPANPDRPANRADEHGLVHTGLNLDEQMQALEAESSPVPRLHPVTIGQLVMANAVRRIAEEPLLDQETYTRLLHYAASRIVGVDRILTVHSLDGRMMLRMSPTDAYSDIGIRRVLPLLRATAVVTEHQSDEQKTSTKAEQSVPQRLKSEST